jgi:hypothetical protein
MDVDDLDLDDLLAALNEVASSSQPDSDSDMNPNDDPDNGDFEPNDNPDDVDDPEDVDDDPRSYRDDDDEDNDDDNEGDYSRRPSVLLLEKLNTEAQRWTLSQRVAPARRAQRPMSKADQNIKKIAELQGKTRRINYEMKTAELLAAATKKHKEASVASYLASLSPAEKREHDEDMRRIAEHYSAICPEASPDWRKDATAAFGAHYALVARRTGN